MPRELTEATNRERAALAAFVLGIVNDWRECYIIGADRSREDFARLADQNTPISRWKKAGRIVKAYEDVQKMIAGKLADARREGYEKAMEELTRQAEEAQQGEQRNNGTSADGKPANRFALIDYSDPANRKRLYNEVIRDAKGDPKTRLDAAKVFEQIQRDDKQAAREQKQVRAYLPLTCHDCPLYEAAKKKVTI